MTAPDTSVLIAGYDPTHPFFDRAIAALGTVREEGALVAHTLAEAHAVLTGAAFGRSGAHLAEYVGQFLDRPPIGLSPADYPRAIARLISAGVEGGALYDGLIALGAKSGGATLVSLDRRAARTYRLCDVDFRLLL